MIDMGSVDREREGLKGGWVNTTWVNVRWQCTMKLAEKMGQQIGRVGAGGREAPLEGECLMVKRGMQGARRACPRRAILATWHGPCYARAPMPSSTAPNRAESPCLFVMAFGKFDMTPKMGT